MSQPTWTDVDRVFVDPLGLDDAALEGALERSREAGLPDIQVAPNQGKQLMLLARAIGATRALEIGTLGGYSTIWLARGLGAEGRVVSLELDPTHADVARTNLDHAGLADNAEVVLGDALQTLEGMSPPPAFDLVFIDADKQRIPEYFEHAIRLSRPGGVIVVDNVIRDGKVADPTCEEPSVLGVRRLLGALAADHRVSATAVQTVGAKGYDGYLMAVIHA